MDKEKQLKEMSDYHRKQSGFTDDDAPPTVQAYKEKKSQYDNLTKRVQGCENKYNHLREDARSNEKKEIKAGDTVKQNNAYKQLEAFKRANYKRTYF